MFKVDSWQHKIEMQLQKGVWCGYKGSWDKADSKIKYDKLLHSSTNMVNVGVPVDTQSGIALASKYYITFCYKYPQECSQFR